MKTRIFLLSVLAVISAFLISCTQQPVQCIGPPTQTYACPDASIVTNIAQCPVQPLQENKTQEPLEPVEPEMPEEDIPSLPDEVKDAFDKAKETVTSYQYKYIGPPNDKDVFAVLVKGTKMKVTRPQYANYLETDRYDTVYLDLEKKTAVAYCLVYTPVCKDKTKAFYPGYEKYLFKTPFDWIEEIPGGELKGSEQVNGRNAWRVEYSSGENLHKVWIDEHYGIPIKIQIGLESKDISSLQKLVTYEYKELGINSVEDKEVVVG
ncbi:MAG: hypothetical protein V1743_06210 [Nanoarchaeota archaeon]